MKLSGLGCPAAGALAAVIVLAGCGGSQNGATAGVARGMEWREAQSSRHRVQAQT